MDTIELLIPKSINDIIQTLKSAMPSYYEISKNFMPYKYSLKLKKENIALISRGIGYPEITLKIYLSPISDDTSKISTTFTRSVFIRTFIWITSMVITFVSLFYLWAVMIGDVPTDQSPVLAYGLPSSTLIVSVTYYLYTEIIRNKEKKRMVDLLNNIFFDACKSKG